MADSRSDVQLKIDWANKRISELASVLDLWINTKPYGIDVKIDSQTQEKIYYITKVPDIPTDFSLMAGEIIQSLRTALDYLACALVQANGGTPSNQTGFPIFEFFPATSEQKSAFQRKVMGMGDLAVTYINQLKPYKGGTESLWRLHELNVIDKHRLLLTVGTAMGPFNIGQHLRETRRNQQPLCAATDLWVNPSKTFLVKVGQEILIDPPNSEINKNPDVRPEIAFNEVGVCQGEPLVPQLTTLLHSVMSIVNQCQGFLKQPKLL